MASSRSVGSRPSSSTTAASSSSVMPELPVERFAAHRRGQSTGRCNSGKWHVPRLDRNRAGGLFTNSEAANSEGDLRWRKPARRVMTDEHKRRSPRAASWGAGVKDYLDALEPNRPRRGRQRTPDSIKKRLAAIERSWPTASPLQRLQLVQERLDLQRRARATARRRSTCRRSSRVRASRQGLLGAQGHLVRHLARARRPRRRAEEGGHHPRRVAIPERGATLRRSRARR